MDAPDIIVQMKGSGRSTVVSAPSGTATRLVELSDVNVTGQANGYVLTYVSANGRYEFHPSRAGTGGGGTANIAVAQLSSNVSQIPANTLPQAITYDTQVKLIEITHTLDDSKAYVHSNGTYFIVAALEIARTSPGGGSTKSLDFWLRVNGVDVSNTATRVTLEASDAASAVANFMIDLLANDYVEIIQAVQTAGIGMGINAFDTLSTGPRIPSVSVSIIKVTSGASFFSNVAVAGQDTISSNVNSELTLAAGQNIVITTDNVFNKVTITSTAVSSVAGKTGAVLLDTKDIAENLSSNLWFTAARVRSNISNVSPINYSPATGVISHADSGVTANSYGNAASIPVLVVDSKGHLTSIVNTAIAIDADQVTSGTLQVSRGGTGQNTVSVNGSLLIGNTISGGFDLATLTEGPGIDITNDAGAITITANVNNAIDQYARDKANGAVQVGFTTINAAGQFDIVADSNNDTLILAGLGIVITTNTFTDTITFAHANTSGVVPGTYGDQSTVPSIVVDARGHVSGASNVEIAIDATQIISGELSAQRGGTGIQFSGGNGTLLIGNTVSSGYDLRTLTEGPGVTITNDKGSITISANSNFVIDQFARDQSNAAYDQANAATVLIVTANAVAHAAFDKANGAAQLSFVTVNVAGQNNVVADSNSDTLILAAGSGITITTDAANDTITFSSTGSSDQFARDQANAAFDKANTANVTGQAAFDKANTANVTGQAAFDKANSVGITAQGAYDTANGAFSKANGAAQLSFVTVNVAGQNNVVADSNSDTLILVAGSGIIITTDDTNDAITIAATGIDQFARDNSNGAFSKANSANVTAQAAFDKANTDGIVAASAYNQANIATTNADAAFARANAAYANANTAIYTAAQIRANISNTTPVLYDPATGIISLTTVPVSKGGTGQTAITVNGSLLIGNTVSGGFDVNPITPGTGISVVNDKGSITIAATGGSSTDQFARDHANGAFDQANIATTNADAAFTKANASFTLATTANTVAAAAYTQANIATTNADAAFARANAAYANANTAIYTAAQIRANISNTAPINYDPSTGIISHALSGATASGYGDAATVAKVVVDSNGHVTSVTNTSIAISATQITSGTLAVTRGGTGQTAITVNGSLLIGNTVSGGFDVNAITPGTNITITNDKGSITIASSDAFAQAQANAAFAKANIATTNADAAFARANAAYANANTAIYTAAQIRANISNTTPVLYDPSTGIISLTTVPVSKGGTGQTAITVNGSLLIGNTVSGGFDVNPITPGSGITVTNDKGSITIATIGGAAATVHQTEINFGTTPISENTYIIVDATVTATSNIVGGVAYVAPTGKDLDELEMDQLDLKFAPGSGQFTLYATSLSGPVSGAFKINYTIG